MPGSARSSIHGTVKQDAVQWEYRVRRKNLSSDQTASCVILSSITSHWEGIWEEMKAQWGMNVLFYSDGLGSIWVENFTNDTRTYYIMLPSELFVFLRADSDYSWYPLSPISPGTERTRCILCVHWGIHSGNVEREAITNPNGESITGSIENDIHHSQYIYTIRFMYDKIEGYPRAVQYMFTKGMKR